MKKYSAFAIAREAFRHTSYTAQASNGVIMGLGASGYRLALTAMADIIDAMDD